MTRLIAKLDIKGPNLIKGVQFEGLRIIGNPGDFAQSYYDQGIDELIYIDTVATLYGRNSLDEVINRAAKNIFVPLTVGGGIRSVDDVERMLSVGADKVAVNTAAIKRPYLISEIANKYGSQCVVASIEAKQMGPGHWEAYTDNGRERSHKNVLDWVKEVTLLGAGEILLTSVDLDGTRKGFDCDLIKSVSDLVSVPVNASGGMGVLEDVTSVVNAAGADAVVIASTLHYGDFNVADVRNYALDAGLAVRENV